MNKKYIGLISLYVLSIGMLIFTNPQHVSPIFLALPLLFFALAVLKSVMSIKRRDFYKNKRSATRSKSVIFIAVALPTLILLLQSIGQLTLRDVITLGLIGIVLSFYVSKLGLSRRI